MTAIELAQNSGSSSFSSSSQRRPLPPELVTGIVEAVTSAPTQLTRADVVADLVHEICDAVAWLYPDPHHVELCSLRRLSLEVDAHRERVQLMATMRRGPSSPAWS